MPILEDLYARQRARELELDHFFYSASFGSIAPAATTPVNTSIQADSDFLVRYITSAHRLAAGTISPSPALLISFSDTGSGRNWQDQPLDLCTVCGGNATPNGSLVYILPEPKLISGGSVITTTLTNFDTGITFATNRVTFHGEKIFYFRRFQRGT